MLKCIVDRLKSVDMYDPRTNQWQRDVATIPRDGRMRAGAVTINGVISLLDGR